MTEPPGSDYKQVDYHVASWPSLEEQKQRKNRASSPKLAHGSLTLSTPELKQQG